MPTVLLNDDVSELNEVVVTGIGSLSASNEPLYVLDGVPVMSGDFSSNDMNTGGFGILSTLNPADIENITILKDAASASIPSSLYSYYGLYDVTYSYNDQPAMVESSLSNDKLSCEKNYAFNVGTEVAKTIDRNVWTVVVPHN